jgi:hypothetical protein
LTKRIQEGIDQGIMYTAVERGAPLMTGREKGTLNKKTNLEIYVTEKNPTFFVRVTHLWKMHVMVGNVMVMHVKVRYEWESRAMISYVSIMHVLASHVSVSHVREMHTMVCHLSVMHVMARHVVRTRQGWLSWTLAPITG